MLTAFLLPSFRNPLPGWMVGLLLALSCAGRSAGQANPSSAGVPTLNLEQDLGPQLLPFEQICEIALRNAPALKSEDAALESQDITRQMARRALLRGISFSTGWLTSNQAIIANGNVADASLAMSRGYRVGVSASLGLGDLINRRPILRQADAEYRSAVARREGSIQQFRINLFRLYQATLLAQRRLLTFIQGEQIALVAFQTAEINWKEARFGPAEYAGASEIYTGARTRVEAERVAVVTNLFELATLVGVPLTQLQSVSNGR